LQRHSLAGFASATVRAIKRAWEAVNITTSEEAKQSATAIFEFVHEKNGIMIFRKPKRFINLEM